MSLNNYLDPATVKRKLIVSAVEHPGTVYPLTGALLAGAANLFVFGNQLYLYAAAGLMLAWSCINLPVLLATGQSRIEKRLLQQYQQAMEQQREQKLAALKASFVELDSAIGQRQFSKLNEKFDNFRELLGRKLDPQELTYSRYLNKAMTVYHASLDNLIQAADLLKSISTIQVAELEQQLQQPDLPQQQHTALSTRLALYHDKQQAVQQLFVDNEAALTLLDVSAAELASITTGALEKMALQDAMKEFDHHIQRLARYSIRQDKE
ncbi:hypothetical protein [Oceanobacter mangrovi]|uniref:hypothetical protein n=1 Tax=Oceanobacter mangrovi TaxID=2862510 RepID=UPI001C8E424F|nr:hypothetical protein [Oceanobacter mangrovi]